MIEQREDSHGFNCMSMIAVDQGSDAWFRARAGRFTASRMADLMAKTRGGGASTSRANLLVMLAVERITGQCVKTYQNDAMRRGTELEPEARAAYEAHKGILVEEVGLIVHPTMPYVGASPDGLIGDDGLLEIKAPSAMAKHLDALRYGSHAVEYRWQLMCQMFVCGRAWVHIVSYDPRFPKGAQLAITKVLRDEAAICALEAECIAANAEVEGLVNELREMCHEC